MLENVTGCDGIRAEAGRNLGTSGGFEAYLLDMLGSGVGLHIEYVNLLYRQLHDLSETPRTAFGDSGRSLSGVALEVEIQPLIQKVMRKRRVWDAVYRKRNAMILALLERFGGAAAGRACGEPGRTGARCCRPTATAWSARNATRRQRNPLPSSVDGRPWRQ